MKKQYVLLLLICASFRLSGQITLNNGIFEKVITDKNWFVNNPEQKGEYDIQRFSIAENSVTWIRSKDLDGNMEVLPYELTIIKDNIFELRLLPGEKSSTYVYGYLSASDQLFIRLEAERLKINPGMVGGIDWIVFSRKK